MIEFKNAAKEVVEVSAAIAAACVLDGHMVCSFNMLEILLGEFYYIHIYSFRLDISFVSNKGNNLLVLQLETLVVLWAGNAGEIKRGHETSLSSDGLKSNLKTTDNISHISRDNGLSKGTKFTNSGLEGAINSIGITLTAEETTALNTGENRVDDHRQPSLETGQGNIASGNRRATQVEFIDLAVQLEEINTTLRALVTTTVTSTAHFTFF